MVKVATDGADKNSSKSTFQVTDIGLLPADWRLERMGQLGQSFAGLTYSPTDVREDGVLVLRSSNVQEGRLKYTDNVFVQMDIPDRAIVREGDILICVRNGSRDLIGKCARIDRDCHGMAFGAFMGVFRSPINDFAYFAFQSHYVQRQIREQLGATINQITNKSLNSFLLAVPSTEEEANEVAEALADADALIDSLESLISKKLAIKQGVMQDLLSGRKRLPRFSGDWPETRLGDLGTFFKGSGVRKDEAQSGELPCIRYGEIYTIHNDVVREFQSFISYDVAATAAEVKAGDILFAGSGETKDEIGKSVAIVDCAKAYAGGDIIILRPTECDARYLGYALNHHDVQRQKAAKGQGDAVVHISASSLASIFIKLPTVKEQAAISEVLNQMDAEIALIKGKLNKARQIKQGMMQELLTGRIRLV